MLKSGLRAFAHGPRRQSTVVMKLDEEGRITHFQDRWDDKDMPNGFISFVSVLTLFSLRLTNLLTLPSTSH